MFHSFSNTCPIVSARVNDRFPMVERKDYHGETIGLTGWFDQNRPCPEPQRTLGKLTFVCVSRLQRYYIKKRLSSVVLKIGVYALTHSGLFVQTKRILSFNRSIGGKCLLSACFFEPDGFYPYIFIYMWVNGFLDRVLDFLSEKAISFPDFSN